MLVKPIPETGGILDDERGGQGLLDFPKRMREVQE